MTHFDPPDSYYLPICRLVGGSFRNCVDNMLKIYNNIYASPAFYAGDK